MNKIHTVFKLEGRMRSFMMSVVLASMSLLALSSTGQATDFENLYHFTLSKQNGQVVVTGDHTKTSNILQSGDRRFIPCIGELTVNNTGTVFLKGDATSIPEGTKLQIEGFKKVVLENINIGCLNTEKVSKITTHGATWIHHTDSFLVNQLRQADGLLSLQDGDYDVQQECRIDQGAAIRIMDKLTLAIANANLQNNGLIFSSEDRMLIQLGRDIDLGNIKAKNLSIELDSQISQTTEVEKSVLCYENLQSNNDNLKQFFDNQFCQPMYELGIGEKGMSAVARHAKTQFPDDITDFGNKFALKLKLPGIRGDTYSLGYLTSPDEYLKCLQKLLNSLQPHMIAPVYPSKKELEAILKSPNLKHLCILNFDYTSIPDLPESLEILGLFKPDFGFYRSHAKHDLHRAHHDDGNTEDSCTLPKINLKHLANLRYLAIVFNKEDELSCFQSYPKYHIELPENLKGRSFTKSS